MQLLLITVAAIALIMAAMAVGVIFSNRALRGSCGGPAILDADGNALTCPDCHCRTGTPDEGGSTPAHR